MKSFYFLISLMFIFISGRTQDCPFEINFTTQSQIDSFPIKYPNCTGIDGSVHIGGSNDIVNLNGLSQLNYIGGWVIIEYNTALTTLSGLEAIITANFLAINNNEVLTNLTGLNNLTSLDGWLILYANENLTSLEGLNNLTSIGGNLIIGEDTIDTIGGGNPSLTNIEALEKLTYCAGIRIINNAAITSLNGIENIDAGSIYSLIIYGNPALSTCEVQSVCSYLASPNGIIEIHDNATGCNSQGEVEEACGVGFEEVGKLESLISISPNPASTQITIEASRPMNQALLKIFSINGHELNHYQITEPKTVLDISRLPAGVYFLRFTSENEIKMFEVLKY